MSPELLHVISYFSIVVLILAVLIKSRKILSLPLHLRWELYPVAHEGKKARYGGSFMEEVDWWTKQRHSSMLGELKVMIPEIFLLKGVWESNRSHWYCSFPFHFGLYLLVFAVFLFFVQAVMGLAGVDFGGEAGGFAGCIVTVTSILGVAGMILTAVGSIALLKRRMTHKDYKNYTTAGDVFNLVFFLAAMVAGLVVVLLADSGAAETRGYIESLISFDLGAGAASGSVTVMLLLFSLLAAYVPLTHMSHFFTKYFMYHHIRWDDTPNTQGSDIEKKVGEYLNYKVSWDAPHIKGEGTKSWADIATENPFQEESK